MAPRNMVILTLAKTTWEGGVRMPSFVNWPGTIPEGTSSQHVVSSLDVLPTLCSILKINCPKVDSLAGVDVSHAWLGADPKPKHNHKYIHHGLSGTSVSVVERFITPFARPPLFLFRSSAPVNVSAVRWGDFKAHFITQCGFCVSSCVS